MILYKRHKQGCQYRSGSSKDRDHAHRCACSVWVEWNKNGKQHRNPVRDNAGQPTSSWSDAEKLASGNTQSTGNPSIAPKAGDQITVKRAIELFNESKKNEKLKAATLTKYTLTLKRLEEYCDIQGITLLAEVSRPVLLEWWDTWELNAAIAKLNNHSRVGTFFEFCHSRDYLTKNPMKDDSFKKTAKRLGKQATKDRQDAVNPLEPNEYAALLKAVDHVPTLTAQSALRVKALMQLQRWSGLSLVDAVCLEKDELIEAGGVYRVVTSRRKTGTAVNNVIPSDVAKLLLEVKNGNAEYFFWSGTTTHAGSYFDKMYRKVFKQAKIPTEGKLSHRFRHTFAVELLKAGVDIRKVSRALGHSSVTVTERYYAKWNKAQQDLLDDDLTGAFGKKH
jgi:site-specific recombinase XerD